MDDRKIFECVAKIPGIRAVQISDLLDEELTDVSEALRSLVDAGDLVRSAGFAPSGAPAQKYDFSEQFKASKLYNELVLTQIAAPAPATAPLPTELVQELSKAGQQQSAAGAKVGEVPSRAERAIAYVKKHGSATDDELRIALDLKANEYPSGILGHAMKTGKVTRKGNRWIPGDGRPVVNAPPPGPSVPVFLSERVVVKDKPNGGAGKPKVVTVAPTPAPMATAGTITIETTAATVTSASEPATPVLRCGIWSDGVVELQRNGKPVAVLMQDEADFMATFLAGVRAKVAA